MEGSFLQQALALAEELGDKFYLAEVLDNSLDYASSQEEELQIAERSLSLRRSLGDVDGIYSTLFYRSHIFSRMGHYFQALQDARESMKYAKMSKNRRGTTRNLFSMGRFFFSMGNYEKSFVYFHQTIEKFRSLGDDNTLGRWLVQVGGSAAWLEATTGRKYGAEKYFDEALEIAHRLSNITIEAEALFYLAELAGFHGKNQKAARCFREAGALFAKVEGPRAARLYQYSFGKAALLNAEWKAAGEHLLAGLRLAVEQRDLWEILHHLAALAVVKVSCQGEEELAARLQGTIDAMRPDTRIVDYSTSILYFPFHPQMVLAAAQNALGEVRCAAAYAEGQSMTLEQAAAALPA